jgi:ATP-dependent DNA helicase RecG
MAGFRDGAVKVLLATSLVEVGVDVGNATVMVIENAEQFGLAQLHQLRGRIGRGAHESFCILLAGANLKPDAHDRLRVLETTTDGFRIAEADLEIRGPGEFLGQQQSGAPQFRYGDLAKDWELARQAREFVAATIPAPLPSP